MGLAAGLVFALLPVVQRYAQEGRSYALVTALVVAETWFLGQACTARCRAWWAGYAALPALSGLLHEFALPELAAPARRPPAKGGAHGVGDGRLLRRRGGRPLGGAEHASVRAGRLDRGVRGRRRAGLRAGRGIGVACAAIHRRAVGSRALGTLALPLLLVPPAALLLASVVKPLYVDRYVLYAQAGLALLVGAALDTLWRSVRPRSAMAAVTAAAVLVAVGPVGTHLRGPQSRTDDVTAVARAVPETAAPGDGVLFLPGSRRVWALGHEPASYGALDLALADSRQRSHTLYGTELPPAGIRDRVLRVSRVVVVREPARERHESGAGEEAKEATLRDHFTRCDRRAVGTARIEAYQRGDHC